MMDLDKRIGILVQLGDYFNTKNEALDMIIESAYHHNAWFTEANTRSALKGIANAFLTRDKLTNWLAQYKIPENSNLKVGLILAGNIPAVGFNDVLCNFLAGHISLIKYAEKDKILIPHFIDKLIEFDPNASRYFQNIEVLKNFDAVIATGSNNSSIYFESYFGKYPHIIRKNRNGVAVLDGNENKEDIIKLGKDIFSFFGLGCRNVSKLYIPYNYNFDLLLNELMFYKDIAFHNKYKNNFDYNIALFLLNKIEYIENGILILTEDPRFASRIATCHFQYYDSIDNLKTELLNHRNQIQCIVGKYKFEHLPCFEFGDAQCPTLYDFSDGVDTMEFLCALKKLPHD